MLNVQPLHLFVKREALKKYFRLRGVIEFGWSGTYKNKKYSTSHMCYWKEEAQHNEGFEKINDGIKEVVWDLNFKVDSESFKNNGGKIVHSEYNIYMDGSKMSDNVGACFIILKGSQEIHRDCYKLP